MIGVDTNALVRCLVQDDPGQSPLATQFVEQRPSADAPGQGSPVAPAETVRGLSSRVGATTGRLLTAVASSAPDARFVVRDEPAAWPALQACEPRDLDPPHALVRCVDRHHGCERTVTFDRRAARLAGLQRLATTP